MKITAEFLALNRAQTRVKYTTWWPVHYSVCTIRGIIF